VATDSAGNVYVADQYNHTIRKITPAGVVTTLAGTAGAEGSADGTGAAARFRWPNGVATDAGGNVYVADSGNGTIRKITPAGVVTTLAGTAGVLGQTDGIGSAASFRGMVGVATDSGGNVYVADFAIIRKVTPAGVVTTFAGTAGLLGFADGTGAAARFSFVSAAGLATDSAGNVYVADNQNSTIRKITPAGVVTTLAGSASTSTGSADGTGAAARFYFPAGLATDAAGNVYVADTGNHTIRKITPTGVVTTVVGVAGQIGFAPGGMPGLLRYPIGIAISGTSLYITQSGNHGIASNGIAVARNL
ncbi:MAG: hypothetical protein ABI423_12485, partial [Burkholderiales bacterium]